MDVQNPKHKGSSFVIKDGKNLKTIKALYRQQYIISKLIEAGYKTDPMIADNYGKSGFFYAMESGDIETIQVLYDYVSGSFNWDNFSPRNPNNFVLDNLEKLKYVLETSIKIFEKESKLKPKEKCDKITFVSELIQFNRFQADVCRKILTKKQEYSDATDKVTQADIRKEIIISILSTHEEFSIISEEDCERDQSHEAILHQKCNSYMKHSRFYNTLDITTAMLFFDNIFLLKEKLLLEDGEYEKADSSFLYFILCSSCYNETRLSSKCRIQIEKYRNRENFPLSTKKLWCTINFLERLKLEDCLKGFKNLLVNTSVSDENTTQCLPECEVKTLTSLRQITDTFILKRMMHYIELATEVDLEEEGKMGMLIIERALQVLGESVKFITSSQNPLSISESLLVSSFPVGTKRDIKKIRDLFSHLDRKKLFSRLEVERRPDLFKDVKADLENIKVKFSNIFDAQMLRVRKYMFENGSKLLYEQKTALETLKKTDAAECQKLKSMFSSLLLGNQNDPKMLESNDQERSLKDKKLMLSKRESLQQRRKENKNRPQELLKVFKYVENSLEMSIAELTSRKLVSEYKINIDLHFKHIFEHLRISETLKISETDDALVNYHMECIRIVLQTVVEESSCSSKRKFLNRLNDLKFTITPTNEDEISTEKLKEIETVADEVNKFYKDVIRGIKVSEETYPMACTDFPGITKLEGVLSGHFYHLTEEEKRSILESASEKSKEIHESKKILIESLEKGNFLPRDAAAIYIKKLHITESKRKELENDYADEALIDDTLPALKKVRDYYGNLKCNLENDKELNAKDFETICKDLKLTDSSKKLLRKVVKGQCLEEERGTAHTEKALLFLLNRITLLEELMIKSKPYIEKSWVESKGEEGKELIKSNIMWHYFSDPKLQAAVEMLLFDCMNLLSKRPEYVNFMRKSVQLLTGINLRNVLGHGNPLLETLNQILDPSDLPSELVSKALELISDRELIKARYERDILKGTSK